MNKLSYECKVYDLTEFWHDYKEAAVLIREMSKKIQEIIDYINCESGEKKMGEENFNFLIKLILNNTRLSYDKNNLSIDEDKVILEVIKVLSPQAYEERFEKLQKEY